MVCRQNIFAKAWTLQCRRFQHSTLETTLKDQASIAETRDIVKSLPGFVLMKVQMAGHQLRAVKKVMTNPTEVFLTEKRLHHGGCFHASWRCTRRQNSKVMSINWNDLEPISQAKGLRPCKICFDPLWLQLYHKAHSRPEHSATQTPLHPHSET